MKRSHVLILGTVLIAGAAILASLIPEAEQIEVAVVEEAFELEASAAESLAVREPTPDEAKREFVPAAPSEPRLMSAKEKIARGRARRREALESRPAGVRVVVRNADNQAPLAGFVVELIEVASASPLTVSRTDSDGAVRFDLQRGLGYEARTTVPGTANRYSEPVAEDADGDYSTVFLEIPIVRTQLIRGQVIAALDGGPIGGAELKVFSIRESTEPDVLRARADGRFEVELPLFTEAMVSASTLGFAPGGQLVSGAELESEVLIELEHVAALDVRVLDIGGLPVSGISVTLRGDRASTSISAMLAVGKSEYAGVTGSNGELSFEELPPGLLFDVRVVSADEEEERSARPFLSSFGPRSGLTLVSLEPGERRSLELFHGGGIRIAGTMVDADGAVVPNHPVGLFPAMGDSALERLVVLGSAKSTTVSDAGGRFYFQDVEAGGWWLRADTDEASSEPVFVRASAELSSTEVTLVLHRGLYISGVVVDPSGRCVRAEVYALAQDEWVQAKAGEDGQFRLGPLRAGTYQVGTQDPKGFATAKLQRVEAGTSGVTVALREGGRLWLRAVDEEGVPLDGECWISGGVGDEPIWEAVKRSRLVEGEAHFKRLIPGEAYYVFVSSSERVAMSALVRTKTNPPAKPLLLVATRGAQLELKNPSTTALRIGKLHLGEIGIGLFQLAPGQIQRMAVPVGEITVEEVDLRGGEFVSVKKWQVECRVGEVTELRIE